MSVTTFNYGKRPLGHGEGGGVGNAFQTQMCRIDYRDVATHTTTYNIFDIPAGTFVTACYFVVETEWDSSGDGATVLIDESEGTGGTYITAAVGVEGNLTVGSVIKGHTYVATNFSNLGVGLGDDDEFSTSARTIDWTTGTESYTAGVGVLLIEYIVIPQ